MHATRANPPYKSAWDSRRGVMPGDDLLGRPAGKTGAGGRPVSGTTEPDLSAICFSALSAAEEQPRIGQEDFCMLRLCAVAGVGKDQKCGIGKVLCEDDGVD